MGKAAQIISSVTGVARRTAEAVEHQLKAAGLLVTEEEVGIEEEKKGTTKAKDLKEVSKQ